MRGRRNADAAASRNHRGLVDRAAAVLALSEFELFGHAHRLWFGRDATAAQIEPHFGCFLTNGDIPFWVRHFAREVERLHAAGTLDPSALGISAVAPTPREAGNGRPSTDPSRTANAFNNVLLGGLAGVSVVAVVAWLIYLAVMTQQSSHLRCLLPPCY